MTGLDGLLIAAAIYFGCKKIAAALDPYGDHDED